MARSTEQHSALSLFDFAEEIIAAARTIEEAGRRGRDGVARSHVAEEHAVLS